MVHQIWIHIFMSSTKQEGLEYTSMNAKGTSLESSSWIGPPGSSSTLSFHLFLHYELTTYPLVLLSVLPFHFLLSLPDV